MCNTKWKFDPNDRPRLGSRILPHEPMWERALQQLGLRDDLMDRLASKGWQVWFKLWTNEPERPVELKSVFGPEKTAERCDYGWKGTGADILMLDINDCEREIAGPVGRSDGSIVLDPKLGLFGEKGPEERFDTFMYGRFKENGQKMRQFATGATRDIDTSKYDYEAFLSPMVIEAYAAYMHENRQTNDGTFRDGDNWQKGIPLPVYGSSGMRHVHEWHKVLRDVPVEAGELGAVGGILFNVMGWMHETMKKDPEWFERELAKYRVFRAKELAERNKK